MSTFTLNNYFPHQKPQTVVRVFRKKGGGLTGKEEEEEGKIFISIDECLSLLFESESRAQSQGRNQNQNQNQNDPESQFHHNDHLLFHTLTKV